MPSGVWDFNCVSFGRFINIDDTASNVVVGHRVLVIDVQYERRQVCLTAIGLNDRNMQILLEDWVIIILDDVGFDLNIASLGKLAPNHHKGVRLRVVVRIWKVPALEYVGSHCFNWGPGRRRSFP